uniref:Uncharacterized protein n=1 Tax=Globodera rostochiensis TaxID=31243 RepID=A0A914H459_GLORO
MSIFPQTFDKYFVCSAKVRFAVKPLKRNDNRIVQCCFCELIVRPERFGGRESAFCSSECISKRVDLVRKCVKESKRILLINLEKKHMDSDINPTIETLEMFISQKPSYNPVIGDARLEAATQRVVLDLAQQEKNDLMRRACATSSKRR